MSLVVPIACFVAGLFLGGKLRDAIWREKAESGFQMESKGRLYTVTLA